MGRLWSLLFLAVPIAGVGCFVWAISQLGAMQGHWLPENVNQYGPVIDNLFMFILVLTGVIFIGTSLALFWFLWKYDVEKTQEPVKFVHGSHSLEIIWSIIPAATLLFIAIYQMNAWADSRMRRPQITEGGVEKPRPPIAEVTGRQFEWRIRYPGPDAQLGTPDDIFTVNDLHLPVGEDVVLSIKSEDVLHSFFLPNMRVKHDVVPGMKQYTWFRPIKTGVYDIVCAELCGWGHYKMRGQMVIESREKFEAWLADQAEQLNQDQFEPPAAEEE